LHTNPAIHDHTSASLSIEFDDVSGMDTLSNTTWFFFDAKEQQVVAEALTYVRAHDAQEAEVLREILQRLGAIAAIVRESPSIASTWRTASWRDKPDEALVDLLCRVPSYDVELHLPTRAVLGQAWIVAKINALKAVGYALARTQCPSSLTTQIEEEVGQSIYSKMVEELLTSIVTDGDGVLPTRIRAARVLFRMWDERLLTEIDDIAPILEAAWRARNRVRPVLGTLLGTHEIFALFKEIHDERFLDYYTAGNAVSESEMYAFEEFIFGISHEAIGALRSHLTHSGLSTISPGDAQRILGPDYDAWGATFTGAQAIYSNYRKRMAQASCRAFTRAHGPHKVAEEYVLRAYL
jgi:hypothetical protein